MMASSGLRSTMRSRITGNDAARNGSMVIVLAVVELAHVQLAGGGALLGAVGLAVDHQAARAADALAAVAVEHDGLAALVDQPLVDDVEHLEERHVLVDVEASYVSKRPASLGPFCRQTLRCEVHATCSSSG